MGAQLITATDWNIEHGSAFLLPSAGSSNLGKNVWILDHEQGTRDVVRDLLCRSGYTVRLLDHPNALFDECKLERPDCLIIDHRIADVFLDGLKTRVNSKILLPVIFLSHDLDLSAVVKAIRDGGFEFILKPIDGTRLLAAVQSAISDAQHRKHTISRYWELSVKYKRLTMREREVLPYVVSGYLNKQTAYELGISEVTARIHRGHIMRKLGATSLADLVKSAARLGIIDV